MRIKEGDKKADIIKAAIDVFAEQGYHTTKIHRIANRAGIATGTIYLYFGNKENILLTIFETVWQQLFERLDKISKNITLPPIEKFNSLIDALFDYFTSNPSLALVFVNEQNHLISKSPEHFTRFYEKTVNLIALFLKEGINKEVFSPTINYKISSTLFLGGLRLLLHEWAHDQRNYPLEDIRTNIKRFMLFGLIGKNIR